MTESETQNERIFVGTSLKRNKDSKWNEEYLSRRIQRKQLFEKNLQEIRKSRPFHLPLPGDARIALWQLTRRDIRNEHKVKKIKEIEDTAFYDHLTGLPGKKAFNRDIQLITDSLSEGRINGAIIVRMDLDKFSWVNEILNAHELGDIYLQQVAKIMNKSVRQGYDMPYRVGGDEFAALLTDSFSPEIGQKAVERIFLSLNKKIMPETFQYLLHSNRVIKHGPNAGQPENVIAFREIAQGLVDVSNPQSEKRHAFLTTYKGTTEQKEQFLQRVGEITSSSGDTIMAVIQSDKFDLNLYTQFVSQIEPIFNDLSLTLAAKFLDKNIDVDPKQIDKEVDSTVISMKDAGKSGTFQFYV